MKVRFVEYVKAASRWDEGPRDGRPEIAVVGRSNVGKSSLINFLLGRKKAAHVSKTPGKTRLIHFFLINHAFYLVDLPGYGYAKTAQATRRSWGPMIESYLLKRRTLSAVVMLIDIRRPDSPLDTQMAQWLSHHRLTTLYIATKGDKFKKEQRKKKTDDIKQVFGISDLIVTSATQKEGREAAWKAVARFIST